MNYRDGLIYLNAIGISNNQIEIIENYLLRDEMDFNVLFDKKYVTNFENILSKGSYAKILGNNITVLENLEERTCKNNINIVTYKDCIYPERLKNIENPPKVLYIRGKITEDDDLAIAIVGSRKHTSYGEAMVNYFAGELAKLNVTVISGMAYGLDTIAHRSALNNEGRTIAVLGSGVDVIYPIKNSNLYLNIINNGAVISEFPLGMQSMPYNFPQRNRIISALSLGVIVAEAKAKSGSLITARIAAEQGKEVFAIPGNITSYYSEGTNLLIRDGAIPLLSMEDILISVSEIQKDREEIKKRKEKINNLTEDELIIYNLISSGINNIDKISIESYFDIAYTNSLITILELKDLIESDNNKDFYIKK